MVPKNRTMQCLCYDVTTSFYKKEATHIVNLEDIERKLSGEGYVTSCLSIRHAALNSKCVKI